VKAVGVTLTNDRFGNRDQAYYLHGNPGSFINLGTSAKLKPFAGTVSMWVRMDAVILKGRGVEINPFIITKNNQPQNFFEGYLIAYCYERQGRVVAGATVDSLQQLTLLSRDSVAPYRWHHIAITYDDDFMSLYIDGVQNIKMAKDFRSVFNPADSVMVGHTANNKNHRFMNGSVDDIFIYNRVLSPAEIGQLYKAPDPCWYRPVLKWTGIGAGILLFIALIVLLSRRQDKKQFERERQKNITQARMYELETRAFKSQMNPHFIFNSLNSIQRFILDQDPEKAHEYLTKFSKLLRRLLESSVSDTILLTEEIEILKEYLSIESLRFDHSFEFEINSAFNAQLLVKIPFMMVQPFAENAIWHGLMPKEGTRSLKISFTDYDETRMICTIDDNGVGRGHGAKDRLFVKKQSLAIEFIRQRLEVLGKMNQAKYHVHIIDKKDADGNSLGTRVEILIPKFT
jgi:hypothetical protein